MDLDNFKEINTIAGHTGADDVLAGYANFLVEQVRDEGDAVARHGSDDFVVMANLDEIQNYTGFLKRLTCLVTVPYSTPVGSRQHTVTSSVGVTVVTKETHYMDALQAADAAAAHVKTKGRNGVALKIPTNEVEIIDLLYIPIQERALDTRP